MKCLGQLPLSQSGETASQFCSSAYIHRKISSSDCADSPVSLQKGSPEWVYDQHRHLNQTALIKMSNVNLKHVLLFFILLENK